MRGPKVSVLLGHGDEATDVDLGENGLHAVRLRSRFALVRRGTLEGVAGWKISIGVDSLPGLTHFGVFLQERAMHGMRRSTQTRDDGHFFWAQPPNSF